MNRLTSLLLIVLAASQLFSQEPATLQNKDLVNKNALLFTFDGLQLNSIEGGIGWKKWTRENRAIVVALQALASREEKDEGQELTGIEMNQLAVHLHVGTEKRFPIHHRLAPYYGGLFGFGYEKLVNKIKPSKRLKVWPSYEPPYRSETQSALFSVSAYFVVGMEYFIWNNLSLSGQYEMGGDIRWGQEKNISTVVQEVRDTSKLNLGVWSSRLMLSLYF
ncbi:MAG: porin family protein [candidate division KSB1 bacterium]|nr:porin family protein [candidate division KSB1 bacterium]MDZ7319048.1 porin family protein [candidate division KSB1 bacterium]